MVAIAVGVEEEGEEEQAAGEAGEAMTLVQ